MTTWVLIAYFITYIPQGGGPSTIKFHSKGSCEAGIAFLKQRTGDNLKWATCMEVPVK